MPRLFLFLSFLFWIPLPAFASTPESAQWNDVPQIAALLQQAGVNGTFVIYDPKHEQVYGYDSQRAATRYFPASTFKIPSSLIGFETGAIRDTTEVFPYDGTPRFLDSWKRDMTIGEAIATSNVVIYQEVARRIGLPALRDFLHRMDYGNQETGNVVDEFWLKGPLAISALEQVRVMEAIASRQSPFSPRSYDLLQSILPRESIGNATLYYKTGWTGSVSPHIGWLVGWVETQDRCLYPFAFNMDMTRLADAGKRLELTKEALKILGFSETGWHCSPKGLYIHPDPSNRTATQ